MKQEKRQPKYDKSQGFPKRLFDLLGGNEADRGEYAKLARAIGVSTAAISNYTSGYTGVSADKLIAIANYFNVSTDYLLGLSDVKTADPTVKGISEYTGLCADSIKSLRSITEQNKKSIIELIDNMLVEANNEAEHDSLLGLIAYYIYGEKDFNKIFIDNELWFDMHKLLQGSIGKTILQKMDLMRLEHMGQDLANYFKATDEIKAYNYLIEALKANNEKQEV